MAQFGNIPWVRVPGVPPGVESVEVGRKVPAVLLLSSRCKVSNDRIDTG